jgi:hypothetical protein
VARTPRTHPRLANDIARNWVLVAISIPVSFFVDEAIVWVFPGVNREALGDASLYLGWALFAFSWTVVTSILFSRPDSATMHRWLAETTPPPGWRRVVWGLFGGGGIYWAVTGSLVAIVSLAAVGASNDAASRPILLITGLIVVAASVSLTITAFSVRYAREVAQNGGLSFPGTPEPRFSDYVYFATHLSISLGGADVVVETSRLRRMVSTHSIVSYAYNAIVLGLLVSVLLEVFA